MIQFSIPTVLSVFAAGSAIAVTSVAVAVPQETSTPEIASASSTATPSASPSPTGIGTPITNQSDSSIVMPDGRRISDIPQGLSVFTWPGGVTFSYGGASCPSGRLPMTVWGNNGQVKSTGSSFCDAKGPYSAAVSMTWNEDTRNSYCYSPLGATTAYRAEVFGQFTEWVPIPEEFKQCVNGQAPEGALPPGEVAPVTPPVPDQSVPQPAPTDSSVPEASPTTEPTP